MKNKSTQTILAFIAIAIMLTTACKKPKDGAPGPAGANGNANVHSKVITTSNWTYTAPSWHLDIFDTHITQSVVDYGLVIVYISNGAGGWQALPYTTYPTSSYSSSYIFAYGQYNVTIYKTDSDLTQPVSPGTQTFKVVAVDGTALIKNPNINWDNYEEVKMELHLND